MNEQSGKIIDDAAIESLQKHHYKYPPHKAGTFNEAKVEAAFFIAELFLHTYTQTLLPMAATMRMCSPFLDDGDASLPTNLSISLSMMCSYVFSPHTHAPQPLCVVCVWTRWRSTLFYLSGIHFPRRLYSLPPSRPLIATYCVAQCVCVCDFSPRCHRSSASRLSPTPSSNTLSDLASLFLSCFAL